jgi:DNA polymerase I-like protein with 3'-5' exonuclease and polymerase domains
MLVSDSKTFNELRSKLISHRDRGWSEPLGFDFETFGPELKAHSGKSKPHFVEHRIAGYSLAFLDGSRYYVPLRCPETLSVPGFVVLNNGHPKHDEVSYGLYKPCERRWNMLRWLLRQPGLTLWAHNAKTELALCINEGIEVLCRLWCSEMAAYVAGMEHEAGALGLKPLARFFLAHEGPDFAEVARGRQSNEIPAAEIAPYAADDAYLTLVIGNLALKRCTELDSLEHFELEQRCVAVTEHMERTGVPIDRARLLADAERCEREADELAARFEALTSCEVEVQVKVRRPKPCPLCDGGSLLDSDQFATGCSGTGRKKCLGGYLHHKNGRVVEHTVEEPGRATKGARVGSDAEVSRWLFKELQWWPVRADHPEVEYGYSVKEEFIRRFAALEGPPGEACRIRLRHQALRKYASTYTRSLVSLADQAADGKLHTSYKQDGTDTTRYSSSMPNQSNLPRSERQQLPWMTNMPDIRASFIAEPGWEISILDFSQLEMRIMAHYSRDPALVECYAGSSPVDVHERTRLGMEARSSSGMKVQRGDAKITNVSTLYAISAGSLANKLAMGTNDFDSYTRGVAQGFIDGFFDTYPRVKRYHERAVDYAKEHNYCTSLTGFKRPITAWNERKRDDETGRSYSLYGYCCRQAINTPIQASAGGILKRALVGLYQRWSDNPKLRLRRDVNIVGQTYDEIIVTNRVEVGGLVRADMKRIMEGAAPELRVPLSVDGGIGPNWSEAK